MIPREYIFKIGTELFKFRSYIPLGLIVLLFLGRGNFFRLYPAAADLVFQVSCFSVTVIGLLIRAFTVGHCRVGTSGRNTKGQYADSLNFDGLYSVVRNPLYLGNFFIILGILFISQSYIVAVLGILLFFCFYFLIILTEEKYLLNKFQDEFRQYFNLTPVFIPNIRLWKRPAIRFNFKRFLAREKDTFFAAVAGFVVMVLFREYVLGGCSAFKSRWLIVFYSALAVWLVLQSIKKYLKDDDGIDHFA